jgi:hypothetical protein
MFLLLHAAIRLICSAFVLACASAAAQVLLAVFGIPWATTMVVPFTLLARIAAHSQGLSIGKYFRH